MKTTELTKKDLSKSKKQIIEKINSTEPDQQAEQMPFNEEKKEPDQSEILKAFNEIKAENEALRENRHELKLQIEELKSQKPLKMDFEKAAQIFREKAKLLNQIGNLDNVKTKLNSTDFKQHTESNGLESSYYYLGLYYSSRSEPVFKVSNLIVIDEFMQFMNDRIEWKINDLKEQVQQL